MIFKINGFLLLYIQYKKKIRKEKINEDIESNYLRIYIGKLTDYKNVKM